MTTETILTEAEIFDCFDKSNGAVCIDYYPDELFEMGRTLEQAVLQSEQVKAWKRDAERYHAIRDAFYVQGTRAFYEVDIGSNHTHDTVEKVQALFDSSIDAAMERQP